MSSCQQSLRTGIKEHVDALTLSLQTVSLDEKQRKDQQISQSRDDEQKACNQQMDVQKEENGCPEIQPTEQEVKKCTDRYRCIEPHPKHRATPLALNHTPCVTFVAGV